MSDNSFETFEENSTQKGPAMDEPTMYEAVCVADILLQYIESKGLMDDLEGYVTKEPVTALLVWKVGQYLVGVDVNDYSDMREHAAKTALAGFLSDPENLNV